MAKKPPSPLDFLSYPRFGNIMKQGRKPQDRVLLDGINRLHGVSVDGIPVIIIYHPREPKASPLWRLLNNRYDSFEQCHEER